MVSFERNVNFFLRYIYLVLFYFFQNIHPSFKLEGESFIFDGISFILIIHISIYWVHVTEWIISHLQQNVNCLSKQKLSQNVALKQQPPLRDRESGKCERTHSNCILHDERWETKMKLEFDGEFSSQHHFRSLMFALKTVNCFCKTFITELNARQ